MRAPKRMMWYNAFVQTLTLRCTLKPTAEQVAALNIAQRAGSMGKGGRNTAPILGISTLHRPLPKAHAP